MKKFFKEFKEFITRGNVLDMAVGVIIGGAFTAIVTALTSQILQPLINWMIAAIVGGDGLEAAVTMLKPAYDELGAVDLANSIYINWGAFITAIINFLLVALILFCIIKAINGVHEKGKKLAELKNKKEEPAAEEVQEQPAEEVVPVTPVETTDDLLRDIRDLLKAKEQDKAE